MEQVDLCQIIKPKSIQAKCKFENCLKCPNYNYEGEKKRLYCLEHKLDKMINVGSIICRQPNCKIVALYNVEGNTRGLYCSQHKIDNMVDIRHKTCIYQNCKKIPNYNIEGKIKGLYCSEHKLDNMINVISKTCIYQDCKKIPAYNIECEKKGLYCSEHKLDNMINVVSKTCIYQNCKKLPIYNLEGETKGLYCLDHKSDNMINVISKKCVYSNCKKYPIYNVAGEIKRLYCSYHKSDNMINVISKTCIYQNCKKIALYNVEGKSKGLYCSEHKLDNMVDVKSKVCKTPLCYTTVKNKYDNHCLRCYVYLFPDKPTTRNYKTKESATAQFITTNFPNFTWNLDKKVEDGCSKKRPDLMCDLGYQVIIVEVDENQHTDYDCSCENKRIMQLSQDVGHRPIIFIRFNPDTYINSNNEKINSCWGTTLKSGILKIKNNKMNEWNERLAILKSQIEYWSNEENKTEKTVEVIQLFYNQNA